MIGIDAQTCALQRDASPTTRPVAPGRPHPAPRLHLTSLSRCYASFSRLTAAMTNVSERVHFIFLHPPENLSERAARR